MEEKPAGDSLHTPLQPSYIPFDIISETILCRLPVKSLLRFRCVCKPWDSLISNDPKFAKKHLRVSPKRQHLVTTSWTSIVNELTVLSRPFDSTLTSEPTLLDYSSIIPDDWEYGLVASCDGILCFDIDEHLAVLYNPSIRKLKNLPYINHPPRHDITQYAFDYDPFIHNYKVIAVSRCNYHIMDVNVRVHSYTLGSDSWKRIKDFPSMHLLNEWQIHGVFISGTVNWLTCHHSNQNDAIVSLHLGKESYQEIPLPDNVNRNSVSLEVMKDCLCLYSQESYCSIIDVWLMKEYGNKESWIKFIRLPYFSDTIYLPILKIVDISDDDNHVLLAFPENHKSKWVVYNFKNNTIKSSKINEENLNPEIYVESLISP